MAALLVTALTVYVGLGLLFAVVFLWRGIDRLDSAVPGSSLGFRLIILPGVAAFWPVLLRRWLHDSTTA